MALTLEAINARVEQVKGKLRRNRLKHGVDYAIVVKYSEVRIMCDDLYEAEIKAACEHFELPVKSFVTY